MAGTPSTTIITYEEQIRGWMKEIASAKNLVDEIAVYSQLKIHLSFFGALQVVDFTALAATEFQRLRALKVRIGTMDLKIAAISLSLGATVWSRNLKDFRKVPGLLVEDAAA
jgi:tRNA(fMet)-specific endonuclease VapC